MNPSSIQFVCWGETPAAHLSPMQSSVYSAMRDLKPSFVRDGVLPFTLASILRKRVGGANVDTIEAALSELKALGLVTEEGGKWKVASRG